LHLSASIAPVPAPDVRKPPMKARLALAEFLLASGDLQASARQSVDWLARYAGVRQAIVAVVDPASPHFLLVAEHGISSAAIADFVIGRDDTAHPLVQAMARTEPTGFARSSGVPSPFGRTAFHAIPLRSGDQSRAHGLLLVTASQPEIDPDVAWLTRQLSSQVARLLTKRELIAMRFGQERMRLYSQQNEQLRRQHSVLEDQRKELEQTSALKSQFLANISHEFRTPLNAILGYTHMLLHGVTGAVTDAQRKSLTRIDSNARHLLALINDILDITRIEAGRMPLKVASFRIADLVDEVMSELEPIIRRSNLAVTAQMRRTLPLIETDRQKVKQIVLNLLNNALKFTPSGSVTIGATFESSDRVMAIAVRDTGVGIPEESQSKIFEDFRQLDDSPTRGYGGTGLGLSICRRLAQMLGGTIDVESQVGEGSTFTLRLPVRARGR